MPSLIAETYHFDLYRVSLEKLDGRLTEAERHLQYELVIQCLQILRAIIHNEIKNIDHELKDRDPKLFRRLKT